MKKLFIITITLLNLNSYANAQTCGTAPSCESLGYTQTLSICDGYDMLKCPFDTSKVHCKIGCPNPSIGDFLYSDFSCSPSYNARKKVIGIVLDIMDRRAIRLIEDRSDVDGGLSCGIPNEGQIKILYENKTMLNNKLIQAGGTTISGWYWVARTTTNNIDVTRNMDNGTWGTNWGDRTNQRRCTIGF